MSRTVRTAAVIGALLVGGAVTGTTFASWANAQNLAASTARSGTIGLTVNGTTTATFTALSNLALNNGATPGAQQSFTATLVNTGTGKNLRMQMFVDDVTTSQTDLDNGLEISLAGVAVADPCPAPTWQALSTTNLTDLTAGGLPAGAQRKLCVSVRMKANAPTATAGKTGTLSFSFRGQQVAA